MSKKNLNNLSWLVLIIIGLAYAYSIYLEKQPLEKTDQSLKTVVEWAKANLPQTGILQEANDGFVYLKVDDNYIHQLFPLLHRKNYVEPPFFRYKNAPGAHISIFYTNERSRIDHIHELGDSFSFEINHFKTVPPGSNEYLVLTVKSPQLEALRKKYGFKSLRHGHDFHITIAKKKERN